MLDKYVVYRHVSYNSFQNISLVLCKITSYEGCHVHITIEDTQVLCLNSCSGNSHIRVVFVCAYRNHYSPRTELSLYFISIDQVRKVAHRQCVERQNLQLLFSNQIFKCQTFWQKGADQSFQNSRLFGRWSALIDSFGRIYPQLYQTK